MNEIRLQASAVLAVLDMARVRVAACAAALTLEQAEEAARALDDICTFRSYEGMRIVVPVDSIAAAIEAEQEAKQEAKQ